MILIYRGLVQKVTDGQKKNFRIASKVLVCDNNI